jgi:predicted ABC-type ATPase
LTDPPFLLVIAGPNGSGKSTLTKYLLDAGLDAGIDFGVYINADEIAQTLSLPEPERSRQAQAIADFQRDACLRARTSFSFETVMSHPSEVEVMSRARQLGYIVTLYFVATSAPEINVRRVEARVGTGGHDVPQDRIAPRYWRSLGYLAEAALVATRTVVFDNSALVGTQISLLGAKSGLRPVAELVGDDNWYRLDLEAEVPQWVFEFLVGPSSKAAEARSGSMKLNIRQHQGPLA